MNAGISISTYAGGKVVKGLGYYQTQKISNLRELVKNSASRYGTRTGFKFKVKNGEAAERTYKDLDEDVDCLGTALAALGLKGAHISIIGENRYEWGVAFFSITNGTGVAVPLDKYLPQNEVENLIERGRVRAVFYSPAFQGMMEDIGRTVKAIDYFICMEELTKEGSSDKRFISMPSLIRQGKKLIGEGNTEFINASIDNEKMSVLLFTSGTTSLSKGVMLSHRNLSSNVLSIAATIKTVKKDVYLSILPLHHTFENTVGFMFMVFSGVCIAYCEGIKHIAQNILEYNVTLLVAVPAIFEAMYKRLIAGVKASGKEKSVNTIAGISNVARTIGIDARRMLFRSIFEKIGPGLRLAVSGAAPLDPKVVTWFDKIGLRLLNGYGLTEASPVVAANNDFVNKPGTVGYPVAGVEVSIDLPDENGIGEILVRGDSIMLGYFDDPEATREAISPDGWYHTGDLGFIDREGFITITGRVKSMIVLSNGKKAFPEEYETLLNKIEGVSDSFVWGNKAPDGDVQICAEIVLDREKLTGGDGSGMAAEEISAAISREIKVLNEGIPKYKIIRYFIMTDRDIIKTTTLKIKRPLESDKVRALLEEAGVDIRKASGRLLP